jgi:hypothetical protein
LLPEIQAYFAHEWVSLNISVKGKAVFFPPTSMMFYRVVQGIYPEQGRGDVEGLHKLTAA